MNLLVASDAYPSTDDEYRGIFVRQQTERLARHLESVTVVSPVSYIPAPLLRIRSISQMAGRKRTPTTLRSDNIEVVFPKYPLIPPSGEIGDRIRLRMSSAAALRVIQKRKPADLVHAHFVFSGGTVGMAVKARMNVPYVLTAHGGDVYRQPFLNKWWRRRSRDILNNASRVITTSMRNQKIISENLEVPDERITLIHNGYDETLFRPMDQTECKLRTNLTGRGRILLSVGNLSPVKGHLYLVQALAEVVRTNSDVLCVIIGRGIEKNRLLRSAVRLGVQDHLVIIDGVPHGDLPFWMNSSDLFVLPSVDEGFPAVIPEALGCGIPVVASNVGGVPEAIVSDEIGLLSRSRDSDDLAGMIQLALGRKWSRETICRHARKQFSLDSAVASILSVYGSI